MIPTELNKSASERMTGMKITSKSEYIRYLMRKDLKIWGDIE
jgi:hypothetical protein